MSALFAHQPDGRSLVSEQCRRLTQLEGPAGRGGVLTHRLQVIAAFETTPLDYFVYLPFSFSSFFVSLPRAVRAVFFAGSAFMRHS